MSRLFHPLYVAYGCLFSWLAWSAIQAASHGAPLGCVFFVLGSLLTIAAVIREGALEDALCREARRAEAIDTAVAAALAAACCERWWTSCGFHHDPTCPNQHRSAA